MSQQEMMIDSRGKPLVYGGRYGTAQHARWLRRSGAGNSAARTYIQSAKLAYIEAGHRFGWTCAQQLHIRVVPLR